MQHNEAIPDVIRASIESCDVVIAETSDNKPNVLYEVGLAHGLKKPTVLLCRDSKSIPFDLAVQNHIIYSNIQDLATKLSERLRATLE